MPQATTLSNHLATPFAAPTGPSSATIHDPDTGQAYQVSIEWVTPEKAKAWLDEQVASQRKLKPGLVDKKLVPDILADLYALNGEPLIFDSNGCLTDGQHRLTAIIKAGKAVKTFIIRGVDPTVMRTIDTGNARTLADHLGVRGEAHKAALGAIARAVLVYEQTSSYTTSSAPRSVSAIDTFLANPKRLAMLRETAAFVATTCRSHRGESPIIVSSGLYGLLYILFRAKDAVIGQEFFERVFSDAGHLPGDPELALRRKLLNARRDKERVQETDLAYMCITAWGHRQNRVQLQIAKTPRDNERLRMPVIAEANPDAYAPGPLLRS